MIFIGPSLLSGIGQAHKQYADLLGGQYIVLGEDKFIANQDVFLFALPIKNWFDSIPLIIKNSKSVICMTVCETETVHEDYGKLFDFFPKIAVPSEFSKTIFSRQFPQTVFGVIRHYIPHESVKFKQFKQFEFENSDKYVFYHIGNIIDHRKNILKLIESFYKCGFGDKALLVLKATCSRELQMNLPNVEVIQGLLPREDLQRLHEICNCYVSFSHSEGVGLGAVEAAMRDKPVIITEYGGAVEYIQTPYTVPCGRVKLEHDDFLFQKGMEWGDPSQEKLIEYMKDAFNKRLKIMDHSHSRELVNKNNVVKQIKTFLR